MKKYVIKNKKNNCYLCQKDEIEVLLLESNSEIMQTIISFDSSDYAEEYRRKMKTPDHYVVISLKIINED